jgi:hypothetical protein
LFPILRTATFAYITTNFDFGGRMAEITKQGAPVTLEELLVA